MAAENNQSPVGPSPLCSPSTSQQSTHTFSSEEEDAEGETESLKEEASFSKEDEFLGENGYYPEEDEYLEEEEVPREEDYLYPHDRLHEDQYWKWREYLQKKASLKGQGYLYENDYPESRENLQKKVGSRERDYLYENVYLEEEEYLQKEAGFKERDYPYENDYLKSRENLQRGVGLKEQDYLYENDYLGGEFEVASTSQTQPKFNIRDLATPGTSQVTTLFAVPTPVSEAASEPHYDLVPLASFTKDGREFLIWKDQSTQTEWFYKTEAPLKLELETELESSHLDSEVYIITEMPEEENEVTATGSGEDLVDSTENEPADLLDIEDISDSFLKSFSYQAVFKAVVRELTARNEQEEDIDIPLTAPLEGENRRKLGILLKKNFEKFKEIILWIMKKRENLLNPKAIGIPTITYRFGSQLSEDKEPERQEEVKEPERQEVKKPRQIVRRKKLEIDTEWIKNKTEVDRARYSIRWSSRTHEDTHAAQKLGRGQVHVHRSGRQPTNANTGPRQQRRPRHLPQREQRNLVEPEPKPGLLLRQRPRPEGLELVEPKGARPRPPRPARLPTAQPAHRGARQEPGHDQLLLHPPKEPRLLKPGHQVQVPDPGDAERDEEPGGPGGGRWRTGTEGPRAPGEDEQARELPDHPGLGKLPGGRQHPADRQHEAPQEVPGPGRGGHHSGLRLLQLLLQVWGRQGRQRHQAPCRSFESWFVIRDPSQ
uniref:Glutamate rich 6B n=1 Tax=Rousettus aegyptiacus TaxID=9407 RepID=A0A7J8DW90_ROUAE|nr:glutamate rich 6B [Rousettus aegyptiacus]